MTLEILPKQSEAEAAIGRVVNDFAHLDIRLTHLIADMVDGKLNFTMALVARLTTVQRIELLGAFLADSVDDPTTKDEFRKRFATLSSVNTDRNRVVHDPIVYQKDGSPHRFRSKARSGTWTTELTPFQPEDLRDISDRLSATLREIEALIRDCIDRGSLPATLLQWFPRTVESSGPANPAPLGA